jgi:hypothetical protein
MVYASLPCTIYYYKYRKMLAFTWRTDPLGRSGEGPRTFPVFLLVCCQPQKSRAPRPWSPTASLPAAAPMDPRHAAPRRVPVEEPRRRSCNGDPPFLATAPPRSPAVLLPAAAPHGSPRTPLLAVPPPRSPVTVSPTEIHSRALTELHHRCRRGWCRRMAACRG